MRILALPVAAVPLPPEHPVNNIASIDTHNSKEHIDFLEQNLLYQVFEKASPKILSSSDYQVIIESKALFARKFNKTSMQLLKRIQDSWKNNSLPDTHS